MKPQTFAILKPNGRIVQGMILKQIKIAGFKVIREEVRTLDMEVLREHYAHHVDKPFFQPMADYLVSGSSILLILEREDDADPVRFLREMVGKTDPKKGEPGQIRHDFGVHHPTVIFMNAIHASDAGEVEEEIARFFPNHT
ncbi:MAG: nucleoside-diphosphate kinase [Candidatus Gracilibacteria bacterium]|nr:nucleoside-diphosphate kinase [Candidatus Gracilibacteria bacterium]